jgi:purine nucleosidase
MTEHILKKRIIVDTDPNLWVPRRDIDDALALLFLMASPEVHIEGITVNFGNVTAPVGYAAARELLGRVGRSIPLFKGSETRYDLGRKNDAVQFLLHTVRQAPGEIHLLALAPLTNVATASRLDETFLPGLAGLVLMGGTFRFPIFSFFGEFNFRCDGRAAATVLSAPVPKTMIPMELCSQAVFTAEHLNRIQEHDTEMASYMAGFIAPWLELNRRVFFRKKGFFPWDAVAAAWLIDPSLFDSNPRTFSIRETGLRRGSLTPLSPAHTQRPTDGFCTANIPESLHSDRFMDLFLSRLRSCPFGDSHRMNGENHE